MPAFALMLREPDRLPMVRGGSDGEPARLVRPSLLPGQEGLRAVGVQRRVVNA